MEIIPAIDILNGQCVRLLRGGYHTARVYYRNPVDAALCFEEQGAEWIHLVDLDAARGRGEANRDTLRAIRWAVSC